MYSHHPAPVDTVSFSEKLAMRSIIQTYGGEERRKGGVAGKKKETMLDE
jgi:hypothetical protein